MSQASSGRRVIEVRQGIVGPMAPRPRNVRQRGLREYPSVPAVYRELAKKYSSPLLMGPPICDELMAVVQHLYTEEEAAVVRHLGLIRGRTAAWVARAEHRAVDQIAAILDRLATQKRCIVSSGDEPNLRYHVLPIVPGTFEMILINQSPETLSAWHRRFIELFEALFETGYGLDYAGATVPTVRYLPVGRAIEAHPMALPTDKLEGVLDRFELFGVGQCQCRLTAIAQGHGCGKPIGNCAVMGKWAESGIKNGWLRQVSKEEMIDIKREAEAHDMVNWMMNVASTKGQNSCSCCGCCCHAMRSVNQFSAPALFAPPHFRPKLAPARCVSCGLCARHCPMGALLVDTAQKEKGDSAALPERLSETGTKNSSDPFIAARPLAAGHASVRYLAQRCIGCGLCVLACQRQHALAMEAVPDYKLPYHSWFSVLAKSLPGMLKTSWKVRQSRKR